jgi:hypothetical protein
MMIISMKIDDFDQFERETLLFPDQKAERFSSRLPLTEPTIYVNRRLA